MSLRQDFIHEHVAAGDSAVVERPLRLWERLYNLGWLRQIAIIAALAAAWQIYTTILDNALLFPTLGATLDAFWQGIVHGSLLARAWGSLSVLLVGYAYADLSTRKFTPRRQMMAAAVAVIAVR